MSSFQSSVSTVWEKWLVSINFCSSGGLYKPWIQIPGKMWKFYQKSIKKTSVKIWQITKTDTQDISVVYIVDVLLEEAEFCQEVWSKKKG